MFDAAVNNGPGRSVKWMQLAVGVGDDGDIGDITKAALARIATSGGLGAAIRCHAQRILFEPTTYVWNFDAAGMSTRLAEVMAQAATLQS